MCYNQLVELNQQKMDLEVIMNKKIIGFLTLMTSLLLFASVASASKIDVNLNNVVNDLTVPVKFDSVAPMTINNSTVVPLRKFCETAGFEVHWTDSEKTAHIILNANKMSALPIERYAYNLLDNVDTRGLNLVPRSISVALKVSDSNMTVKYNFTDTEGDTVSLGRTAVSTVPATIVGDGSIVVPLRSLMEAFDMWVEWDENSIITISIPPFVTTQSDLTFVAPETHNYPNEVVDNWYASVPQEPVEVKTEKTTVDNNGVPQGAVYLGNFRISHYCACSKCCGSYGNATAWAGKINPGTTIAVDPSVIGKLSNVYIDGYGVRRAEDCGGAIKGNRIDVAVNSHSEALKLGVVYKDVWIMP